MEDMNMQAIIYMRMKKYVYITPPKKLTIADVALLTGDQQLVSSCNALTIKEQTSMTNKVQVIEAFTIIQLMQKVDPTIDVQLLGASQSIIYEQKQNNKPKILLMLFVWLLLFVGSAMAIMNFHYDVSMQRVHQRLHYLFTGEDTDYPLWLQIPYSIGLGLGMVLFFNHLFKKKFNEEPSPMEIEIHKYQQDIDQYVQYYENPLNHSKHDKS